MALAHESLGSLDAAQEQFPKALEQYRRNLDLSPEGERKGYAELQCGNLLWHLGDYAAASKMLDAAAGIAGKSASLGLALSLARADMSLSRGQPALAAHPESRWRALALAAAHPAQRAAACAALDSLRTSWGDAAFEPYLHRPDIAGLSRPLLQLNSTNHR